MDLAGKFPTTSSRGNKYVFLWYDYDSNTMKSVAIKSRHQEELRAYNICYEYYALRGFVPQVIRLDNEASTALKKKSNKIIWNSSWCHQAFTNKTLQNAP